MASLRIATRGSRLALWQAERVAALLGGDVELVIVSTTGDQRTDVPIWTIGGTGVFVRRSSRPSSRGGRTSRFTRPRIFRR
jgi:hydroxymethylbilane synthase